MVLKIKVLIADKVNEYIDKYGSSKTFLASRAEMSRQTLNSLMVSENPTLESLIRIAIALQCDVDDLFEFEVYPD